MGTTVITEKEELLSLPTLALRTGLNLDRIRKLAKRTLAPAGLLRKVGTVWVVAASDVSAVAAVVREHSPT